MAKIQVLFIDDDNTLQLLASAMLNTGVFDVISANRTAAADQILKARKMDIIICDVMMPDEDGLKFCRRLRDRGDKTPLLFLSAAGHPDAIKQGMDAGANDYFVKPFDIHELQKKILSMLGRTLTTKPVPKQPPEKKSSGPFGWFNS